MSLWCGYSPGKGCRSGRAANHAGVVEPSRDEEAVQQDQASFLTQAIWVLFALFCKKLMMVLWLQ